MNSGETGKAFFGRNLGSEKKEEKEDGKEKEEEQGRRDSISRVRLGRGSNVGAGAVGGCRLHESISHVRLGRSGDAKTARRVHV